MIDNPRERYLERVDAVFARLENRAAFVRFDLARDSRAREAVFRLRADAVLRNGWATTEELPGGIEKDEYDDLAVHIAGWDGDKLITSSRLVFPEPGLTLPTEAHFDVTDKASDVANLDRMVVAEGYHDLSHRVLVALLGRSWKELRRRGFHRSIGTLTPGMIRLYERIGWTVTRIGPPRVYWGEERYPVRFDPLENAAIPRSELDFEARSDGDGHAAPLNTESADHSVGAQ